MADVGVSPESEVSSISGEHGLRRQLGVWDLVLAQVLCVVGSSWVGVAAGLGRAQTLMWIAAMAVFYLPMAAAVIWLNKAMPLEGGLYAWACIYGIVGAAIQSLFPTVLSNLTTDLRMAGTRMGMVFTILSFATLTGTPIAGQLIEKKGGGYEYGQIFAGTVMSVGCCLLIAARYTRNKKFTAKV